MQITELTFTKLAVTAYNTHKCEGISDITGDIDRFKYISKAFTKYTKDGELKERIILNHLIILYNVFGESASRFLFYKIKNEHYSVLITFLAYLHRLGDSVEINGKMVSITKMKYDAIAAERLQKI